jgi:hypothetical protein
LATEEDEEKEREREKRMRNKEEMKNSKKYGDLNFYHQFVCGAIPW